MNKIAITPNRRAIFFWLSILVGTSLRLQISTLGYNFDLESYWIVSEAALQGKSVYRETARYNYGPLWFFLLGVFRKIAITLNADTISYFHIIITAFLTLIDSILALILRGAYGIRASLFFFLNPVSILITGYHSQFDNFAILVALLACSRFMVGNDRSDIRRLQCSAFVLGLSLSLKHICLFLPLWLWWAYRDTPVKIRSVVLVIPYAVFALLFLPFALDPKGLASISQNVIGYESIYGNGLIFQVINLFVDITRLESVFRISLAKSVFVFLTIVSSAFWAGSSNQTNNAMELLFIYLATLVAFSCSMADQYLAIPLIALARYHNYIVSWFYSLAATFCLFCSPHNIFSNGVSGLRLCAFIDYRHAQILLLALLVIVWRQGRAARKC